jgi:AbrB family looped-hinge helix DNA binding protein
MATVTVSSKGQVVIPRKIREKLKIVKGTKLELIELGEELILIRLPDDPLRALRGMFRAKRPIKEMRAWVKEEDSQLAKRSPARS